MPRWVAAVRSIVRALRASLLVVLVGLVPTAAAAGAPDELSPLPNQPSSLRAQLLETIARPTSVASYGGWAAWSRYDPAHSAYQLIVRNANGEVTAMGVAESPQPFEVSLGPLASGGVGAVYPRCSDTVRHEGCSLELLAIESPGAREEHLPVPGGGSLFRPALWKGTFAFLRVVPRGGEGHPAELFEWTSGSKHLKALALAHNRLSGAELEEQPGLRATDGYTGEIAALALSGTRVAYTRVVPWGEWDRSDLWVQQPGQQPQLIDRIDTGGGAAFGTRTYLTPTIAGSWLYAYRQYHEDGLGDGPPAWVRYSLTTHTAQQARVNFGNQEGFGENEGPLDAAVPLGAGVIWTLQSSRDPSEEGARVLLLTSVKWKGIKRPRDP
ncbi:MAG TPA: hypothetical protein VN892_16420 [Solirubrobacteraceae bacterium]|nr:hypothetical protein [Solirubrobacteraceae bacterium]